MDRVKMECVRRRTVLGRWKMGVPEMVEFRFLSWVVGLS